MEEDWGGMIKWYKEHEIIHLLFPLTFLKDTAFHMAVYSRKKQPLEDLLKLADDDPLTRLAYTIQNTHGNTALHEAAACGNYEAVKLLAEKDVNLVQIRNQRAETPLFRAAAYGKKKIVKYLASLPGQITPEKKLNDIHRQRITKRSDTDVPTVHASILHDAIRGEHFETALLLLRLDESLVELRSRSGKTSFELLANIPSSFKSGHQMNIWKNLLYFFIPVGDDENDKTSSIEDDMKQGDNRVPSTDLESGTQRKIHDNRKFSYSKICKVAEKIKRSCWKFIFREWPAMRNLRKAKRKHECALRLTQMLIEKDTLWLQSVREDSTSFLRAIEGPNQKQVDKLKETKHLETSETVEVMEEKIEIHDETQVVDLYIEIEGQVKDNNSEPNPLFAATRNGIIEIVKVIFQEHPQAALRVSQSKQQNILHVAIMYRQKEIFDRLKKMKLVMTRLVRGIDQNGYTILHHAAHLDCYSGGTRPGPAYQLQDEIKWFKRVEKIMPSHYARLRDKVKNRTAQELFEVSHKDQLKIAQKWIKETSQSCSAVAVLVATVVFAAAYTVPGGSNENGRPILLDSTLFLIFTIMDVISLWSSLTSVVTFLSILTSPFEFKNFHRSLPLKLTLGFSLLFLSVATTMVAFTATVFLIIREDTGGWAKTFSYSASFLPISIFALMQFPLYVAFTDTLKCISKLVRKALPRKLSSRLFSRFKSKKD